MKHSVFAFICCSRNSHLPQIAVVLAAALSGCGGGSNDSLPTAPAQVPPSPTAVAATYTVGGTISGLDATGLVIANGTDTLSVPTNTAFFTMGQPMARGTAYNLTLETQPSDLRCTLTNGSGTIGSANMTNVAVRCAAVVYDVSTLAGNATAGFADGSATTAQFGLVFSVAVDGKGNTYAADGYSRIRKITSDGTVSTLAGSGTQSFADGVASFAEFNFPTGIAVDRNGSVFVADRYNHRIRKIALDGTVSTLAGNGTPGFADGAGVAAQFNNPNGVAVDSIGNVYVTDALNHRIRKVLPDGTVSTVAGSAGPGYSDGNSNVAKLFFPSGIAVDSSRTIFVADTWNHRIRKIALDGTVSTLAGNTRGYAEGRGAGAQFDNPQGLTVDGSGNVIVADTNNSRIRKITQNGTATTLAGSATAGFADGNASTAKFLTPTGVVVDSAGTVFVADHGNYRVRKIAPLSE